MTTDDRIDYERADQANDAARAHGDAHDLISEAHDALKKIATVLDMAQCAIDSPTPGDALDYIAEARSAARRVAEITGCWG